MAISECCNIGVVCCEEGTSIPEIAHLMRKHHVGDVVVVRHEEDKRIPIGIITDRDIVVETIAEQVDMNLVTAGDIMSTPLITVHENESFAESLRLMRHHKIRRLPIVDERGILYGIVSAGDIAHLLAAELSMLTTTITEQPLAERQVRR
ncbi:CBS domain protein [Paucimonas lemoignei]|uniref:CBS domain protein n=1 Tax=Paucimonas lemoignei TaxID=29443 RepID=A0A4R3I3P5_PAULE|nr:CBS domain-containing protein [Paucimonas lemoignei]TCS39461.1 CBS domain protein [Paucimonas lemoignei]